MNRAKSIFEEQRRLEGARRVEVSSTRREERNVRRDVRREERDVRRGMRRDMRR